jgi:SatD family (SatD)
MTKPWAVVVSDVAGSSHRGNLRSVLGAKLRTVSAVHLRQKVVRAPYAVTAGDEFQTVALDLTQVPRLVFDLRRRMRPLGLRIGIGIGAIHGPIQPPVNRLSGQAFEFAREAIQEAKDPHMHVEVRTRFRSGNEHFDLIANLVYGLHDKLMGNPSEQQWATIDAYLAKKRVDLAAKALKISASTASRNLKRSHFWYSQETIETVSKLITFSFPQMHNNVSSERIA